MIDFGADSSTDLSAGSGVPRPAPRGTALGLDAELRFLPGVGEQRAAELRAHGIATVEDLLHHLPFRYEDRSTMRRVAELRDGETATVVATIRTLGMLRTRAGMALLRMRLADDDGDRLDCLWFHANYLRDRFQPGQALALHGRVETAGGWPLMKQPEFQILGTQTAPRADSLKLGRIVPIYEALGEVTPGRVRWLVALALRALAAELPEALPEAIRARMDLPRRRAAFEQVHFPPSGTSPALLAQARTPAQKRLIFEELFFLQAGIEIKRRRALRQPGIRMEINAGIRDRLKQLLPFHPTADQKRALGEIAGDMTSGRPMRRLLQGDVGSGKTIVGLEAAVIAIENGHQVALMAPTQILAAQHYWGARARLAGYRIELQTAATSGRRRLGGGGEPQLVIGTQALLEGKFRFSRLGLIVVDEQHRFGVMQRFALMQKAGPPAHVLVMTATPIPRTLALSLYGDLDASVIREMPPGRLPCQTRVVPPARCPDVYAFARRQMAAGRQAYFVYPSIEESPQLDSKPALRMAAMLRRLYPEFHVGLLHGQMSDEEKGRVMRAFEQGTIRALVATTVVEVGLDVPNATLMIVEQAERFGLAQLHQLRGRVGRPGGGARGRAYCFLVTGAEPSETAMRRLEALAASQDGFELAELDLKLRGPGEFFGVRQSGLPRLEVADPVRDRSLMEAARTEAIHFLETAPLEERRALVRHIRERWQRKYGLVAVG